MAKLLHLHFAMLVLAMLVLAGCFTPNMQGPCCSKADSLNGKCNMYTGPGPDDKTAKTEMCDGVLEGGRTCITDYCVLAQPGNYTTPARNETIYVKYPRGSGGVGLVLNCTNITLGNMSDPCNNIGRCFLHISDPNAPGTMLNASYPVCTERGQLSFDENCKTMLCGNIRYRPSVSLLPEPGKNVLYQNLGGSYSTGLYNALCDFYVLDNVTMRKLSKGSNIFINTLRFGLGSSFSDFEQGKLYFPLSDRFCGFMPSDLTAVTGGQSSCIGTPVDVTYPPCENPADPSKPCACTAQPCVCCGFSDQSSCESNYVRYGNGWGAQCKWSAGACSDANSEQCAYCARDVAPPARDRYVNYLNLSDVRTLFGTTSTSTPASQYPACSGALVSSCSDLDSTTQLACENSYMDYGGGEGSQCAWRWVGGEDAYGSCSDTPGRSGDLCSTQSAPATCAGSPIPVDFAPCGGSCSPQTCAGACSTESCCNNHYILYNNGQATQCGWAGAICADLGEDTNTYCTQQQTSSLPLGQYYGPFNPGALNATVCAGGSEADFPPAAGSGYLFKEYTEGSSRYTDPKLTSTYLFPDVTAYKYSLYGAYWNIIRAGSFIPFPADSAISKLGNRTYVPYECASPTDCISGICAKDDFGYERGYCQRKDGTWANCLCYEKGQRMQDGNTVNCEPLKDDPQFTWLTSQVWKIEPDANGLSCCQGWGWGDDEGGWSWWWWRRYLQCGPNALGTCRFEGQGCSFLDADGNQNAGSCAAVGQGWSAPTQSGAAQASQIIFFNQSTDGYIGYAVMDPDQFESSMFYQRCGLSRSDYVPYYARNESLGKKVSGWSAYACLENSSDEFLGTICTKAQNLVRIKSKGQCADDDGLYGGFLSLPTFPKLGNTQGWCDSCTFATMVGLNLDDYWSKFDNYTFGCPWTTAIEAHIGAVIGIDDAHCGGKIREYIFNLGALRNRVDSYLKAGVMPVFWYTQGGVGQASTYSGTYDVYHECGNTPPTAQVPTYIKEMLNGYFFYYAPDYSPFFESSSVTCGLVSYTTCSQQDDCSGPTKLSGAGAGEALGESGGFSASPLSGPPAQASNGTYDGIAGQAAELGCYNSHTTQDEWCRWTAQYNFLKKAIGNSASMLIIATDDMDANTIAARAQGAKASCPRCMTALYSPKLDATQLSRIFGCDKGEQYCRANHNSAWTYIDTIAYDENINDRAITDKNTTMIGNITERARKTVSMYGKPSFAYNLVVDDSKNNWQPYNDTLEAFSNLFSRRYDVVNAGIFALMYKNWKGIGSESLAGQTVSVGPDGRDDKFCAFEKAVDAYFQPVVKKTVFSAVLAYPPEAPEAACVECNSNDLLFNSCDRACENGVDCTMPQGAGDPAGYRCPSRVAVEPCTPCTDPAKAGLEVECNRTLYDGTTVTGLRMAYSALSDKYGDYIASLRKSDRCCLNYTDANTSKSYNYTYTKISGESLTTTPIRYPRTGNPLLDCGLVSGGTTFCGLELNVRDYTIDCGVVQ